MPKILGALLIVPLLFASAVILGMVGGYLAGILGISSHGRIKSGLQDTFTSYYTVIFLLSAMSSLYCDQCSCYQDIM